MGKKKSNGIKKRQNKLNHIRNLIEEQSYKRALYEVVNYVNTYPDDTLGHYLYGKLLLRKNELQEARRQFQLVAEYQDENEVKSLMNLATIARREGDPEEAIKYYIKVIEDSDYTDVYAINVLAHLYRYEKKSDEAIALLEKCELHRDNGTNETIELVVFDIRGQHAIEHFLMARYFHYYIFSFSFYRFIKFFR